MKGYREKPYTAPVANRLKRAERQRRWNAIATEAKRANPVDITGEKYARYLWLQLIASSDLPPLARLVAHTLALHGRSDGSNIFPGVRELAQQAGISQRSVSTHLDRLQLSGYLWRYERRRNAIWSCGFLYALCAPKAILSSAAGRVPPWEKDPHWRPDESIQSAEAGSAPINGASAEGGSAVGAEGHSAPTPIVHEGVDNSGGSTSSAERRARGAETGAGGAERHDMEVLNGVQVGAEPRSAESYLSLRIESEKESESIVSARADRYAPSAPSEDEIRAKIRKLAKAGISDDEIIRMLAQYKLTPEQVAAAHAQGQQPDG